MMLQFLSKLLHRKPKTCNFQLSYGYNKTDPIVAFESTCPKCGRTVTRSFVSTGTARSIITEIQTAITKAEQAWKDAREPKTWD